MNLTQKIEELNAKLHLLYISRAKGEDSYMRPKIYEDCVEILTNKEGMFFLMSHTNDDSHTESYLTRDFHRVNLWMRTPDMIFSEKGFEGLGFDAQLEWTESRVI